MDFSAIIKEKLLSLISEIDQYHWLFTRNPEKDFSRIKKWSFGEIVRFIITMEGKSFSLSSLFSVCQLFGTGKRNLAGIDLQGFLWIIAESNPCYSRASR